MPLTGTKEQRFDEFRHGQTYARTQRKYGKRAADRQMQAAVLGSLREKKRGKKRKTERRSERGGRR